MMTKPMLMAAISSLGPLPTPCEFNMGRLRCPQAEGWTGLPAIAIVAAMPDRRPAVAAAPRWRAIMEDSADAQGIPRIRPEGQRR
jgi:hypothetical protein